MKCQADGKLKTTWVRTAAARDCTAWSPESPTADTYTPITPPKPTSVTASCANGVLTVTWEPAGAGLAEATAYKPRIFTGNPPTESANWTANTAGTAT
ncbi:MAG: hypothetical protein KTV68_18620, partial [Acidimicrobiia bacterium]|nr:hypothetical protein [Acidimicrobiia bacterium]